MALDIGGDRALSRKAMKAELLDAETESNSAFIAFLDNALSPPISKAIIFSNQ